MDRLVWAGQLLLALAFAVFGASHAFALDETRKQVAWLNDVSRELMLFVGLAELAAAVGLIVPTARVLRWAAPLAALGLVVLMTFGTVFHIGRGELTNAAFDVVLAALAAFVAYGRRDALPWRRVATGESG
jgi:putative oxidoreductase